MIALFRLLSPYDTRRIQRLLRQPARHKPCVQWGNADVWKVGTKVFAIGGWQDDGKTDPYVTFKVSDMAYDILKDQEGLRPAPYLASRGMKWIQRYQDGAMSDDDLKAYLTEAHRIISLKLTKKMQRELGLNQD